MNATNTIATSHEIEQNLTLKLLKKMEQKNRPIQKYQEEKKLLTITEANNWLRVVKNLLK